LSSVKITQKGRNIRRICPLWGLLRGIFS
jgi:hypothetical protein